MKTRNDFVSNSSSCSFMLNDVAKFAKELDKIVKCDEIPYDMEALNITLYGNKEDIENVAKQIADLHEEKFNESNIYSSWMDKDQYEINATLHELMNIDKNALMNIRQMNISCDDYNQSEVLYISLLYKFAEKMA